MTSVTAVGDQMFSKVCITSWMLLPTHIRDCQPFPTFKRLLNSIFFSWPMTRRENLTCCNQWAYHAYFIPLRIQLLMYSAFDCLIRFSALYKWHYYLLFIVKWTGLYYIKGTDVFHNKRVLLFQSCEIDPIGKSKYYTYHSYDDDFINGLQVFIVFTVRVFFLPCRPSHECKPVCTSLGVACTVPWLWSLYIFNIKVDLTSIKDFRLNI